ncbi:hypothetical protein MLPF_0438 [Mycobacterium lepromatosis]|nr:hypothetical protein MLPF_0438 [Mycobacterium lepromatosis]
MAEAFRVDLDALVEEVHQMAEFRRYAKSMLAETDSLVTSLHTMWSRTKCSTTCRGASALNARRRADTQRVSTVTGRRCNRAPQLTWTPCQLNKFGDVVVNRWTASHNLCDSS